MVRSRQLISSAIHPYCFKWLDPRLFPVQYPVAIWSKCLAQVFPEPGNDEIAVIDRPSSGLKNLGGSAHSDEIFLLSLGLNFKYSVYIW